MPKARELFGKNCKGRMSALGINQSDLGRKLEVAPSMVSSYINGKIEPGLDLIERWADALECKPADLLKEEVAAIDVPQDETTARAMSILQDPERLAILALILSVEKEKLGTIGEVIGRFLNKGLEKKKPSITG